VQSEEVSIVYCDESEKIMINNYNDFCDALINAGFSLGSGGNNEGVFALLEHNWDNQPPDSKIQWHTGNPETDPWEWRMRVLDERTDIAYGKLFFKKSGYITKEWYPYFLAARRDGKTFDDMYSDGLMSHFARRIYDMLRDGGAVPSHGLKQLCGFSKEEKGKFDSALIELQMGLFVTMCGRKQKISMKGQEYGWASTMFCTTEEFWDDEVFHAAAKLTKEEAKAAITEQIYKLNPNALPKKVAKFILK